MRGSWTAASMTRRSVRSAFSHSGPLTFSQVILSFGIPFALVPLVLVSSDRRVMGTGHGP
ncbi:MAG: divalent metal cation transporter [Streptosporangiaceae bacterium]